MTDERLKFVAKQSLAMAKTELRVRGILHGILASYIEGHGLHRMRKLEREIEEILGKDWLDRGRAKEYAWGIVRTANHIAVSAGVPQPEACVFVSVINDYRQTAAFDALPADERQRIFEEMYPRQYPQYFEPHDALMASAQTPERVCTLKQRLQGTLLIGEPESFIVDQGDYHGRLKLYGEPPAKFLERLKGMKIDDGI